MNDPQTYPSHYRKKLLETLKYFKQNMPRTIVNLVPLPLVSSYIFRPDIPGYCKPLHEVMCSCWVGQRFKQTREKFKLYEVIQRKCWEIEEEIVKRFHGLQDFAVIYQPFTRNMTITNTKGHNDYSLLAYDCFHLSQKGQALVFFF